ncbi:MAG: energy-coupling factor transporter transmembrane protein EcfT [Leptolyngbyaceae bacterium]|nr:energy-coupling factor transporter transmembrane protein EcfT [Leptolyngbyaceae bacterium]
MDLLRTLPIGLYIEQPVTWLHRIDARVKFLWLLGFLLTPIAASPFWRMAMVVVLVLLTVSARIPFRVWRRQFILLSIFGVALFIVTALLPDGVDAAHSMRLPMDELAFQAQEADVSIPRLPPATSYRYVVVHFDVFKPWDIAIHITRRSVELAIRVSTLTFTLLYSSNLFLLTTAPEEITAGLEDLMQPLKRFKVPVTEIALTLTLSLRFIPLVLEEVQNLVRSIRTRAIRWKKLGIRGTLQILLILAERLLENLLLRSEQIANAMHVRGFTSPDTHQVRWHQFTMGRRDWFAAFGLVLFVVTRLAVG